MSRRDNAALRCGRCRMHGSLCVCGLIPRLETRTRLVLVIHRFEDRKPTNTGRLAAECLVGSRVLVRGHEARPEDSLDLAATARPVLLFPHEGARDLRELAGSRDPVTLIVPDGTWRQASKVRQRVRGLESVPCVTLPAGARSRYRLRFESHDDGLATIEAIARAFGILEGAHVEDALLAVFGAMVERTLWARGAIDARDVALGNPARRGTSRPVERGVMASGGTTRPSALRLVLSARPLRELDGVAIRVERGHRALPRLVVRGLVEDDPLRLQLLVEPVEVVGAELDVDSALLTRARRLHPFLARHGHREEADCPGAESDHRERRRRVDLDLHAELAAVEVERSPRRSSP